MTKNINSFWQIVDVSLLDKRGYLTICLTLAAKDGKLFLRKPEGIRDWYQTLKVKLEHRIFLPLPCNNTAFLAYHYHIVRQHHWHLICHHVIRTNRIQAAGYLTVRVSDHETKVVVVASSSNQKLHFFFKLFLSNCTQTVILLANTVYKNWFV